MQANFFLFEVAANHTGFDN